MIEGHLRRLSGKLSADEFRTIKGRRLLRLGQLAFSRGEPALGRGLIRQSIKLGYKRWDGISYLMRASPIASWLKKKIVVR